MYQCGSAAGCFAFKCYSCQTDVNIYAGVVQIHMLFAWQKWGSLKGFEWIKPIYINQHDRAQKNQLLKTICACSSWKEENLRIQPISEESTLIGCYASKYADKNIFIQRILLDFESHSWQRLPNDVTNVFKKNIIIFHRLCVGSVGTSGNTTVRFHRHRRTFSPNTRISHI